MHVGITFFVHGCRACRHGPKNEDIYETVITEDDYQGNDQTCSSEAAGSHALIVEEFHLSSSSSNDENVEFFKGKIKKKRKSKPVISKNKKTKSNINKNKGKTKKLKNEDNYETVITEDDYQGIDQTCFSEAAGSHALIVEEFHSSSNSSDDDENVEFFKEKIKKKRKSKPVVSKNKKTKP